MLALIACAQRELQLLGLRPSILDPVGANIHLPGVASPVIIYQLK